MDHGTMTGMDHGAMTSTMTADMPAATGSMDGMDHSDHDMMGGCKISMLLNYNTVGSCFISSNWKVTSTGMFAGSCIGIVLLAIFLEFLRRSVKEFDKFLVKQHLAKHAPAAGAAPAAAGSASDSAKGDDVNVCHRVSVPPFRPNFWQQAIRALLHTAQFTVAYFIMLLAMYYNVYVLVCIFLGILVGSYIFQYESVDLSSYTNSGGREPTVCCG